MKSITSKLLAVNTFMWEQKSFDINIQSFLLHLNFFSRVNIFYWWLISSKYFHLCHCLLFHMTKWHISIMYKTDQYEYTTFIILLRIPNWPENYKYFLYCYGHKHRTSPSITLRYCYFRRLNLRNKYKKMQGRKLAFLFLEMAHVSKKQYK